MELHFGATPQGRAVSEQKKGPIWLPPYKGSYFGASAYNLFSSGETAPQESYNGAFRELKPSFEKKRVVSNLLRGRAVFSPNMIMKKKTALL